MPRLAILSLALAFVVPSAARSQGDDAKVLAQGVLDKGATLFDSKDAAAMAATYAEDARLIWMDKDNDTGRYNTSVKQGRAEIESLYRDLFKDPNEQFRARNTVEFARQVSSDLLIIYGTFQPDISKTGKYPFVQARIKQGDKWLIKSLEFFLVSQN
jgi:hypothetical protein